MKTLPPPRPPGVVLLALPSPEELSRWLSPAEQAVLGGLPTEKRQRDWGLGRAAAKHAVRNLFAAQDLEPPAWAAFEIAADDQGAPRVQLPGAGLAVSLSHGHGHAAAWALRPGPEGGLPGIDLERIRPRRVGTFRFYLHPPERAWVEALPGAEPEAAERPGPRDEAAVILWALKEAAFKALMPPRGVGLLDVEVDLRHPFDGPGGAAEVRYVKGSAARAAELGVRQVEAGWERLEEDLVLAWVEARGARLP